jgi:predicted AlkP superfamily pyrophosphatase or phosphodiesterase
VLGPDRYTRMGLPAPAPGSMQGDLMLTGDDGILFTGHPTPEAAAAAPVLLAAHGHAPSLPKLNAAFLMAGPGVREGVTLDAVSMLDLAPTAARLLGVDLPGAEGQPLAGALAAR